MKKALHLLVAFVMSACLCCLPATAGDPPASTSKPADDTLVAEKELMAELEDCPQTEPDRAKKLVELFKQAGLKDVKTQEFNVGEEEEGQGRTNVIATLPGKSEDVIVIGAHLDFVKKGKGVVDNWSGAAMMTNIAQTLARRENQHTFVFVGFDLEERGLWGSKHFVEALTPDQRKKILAMVNIDGMGVSDLSVFANSSADDLESFAAKVAKDNSVDIGLIRLREVESDSKSFMEADIPAVTFVGVAFRDIKIIHSENDRFERIRARRYVEQYQYIVKFTEALDARKEAISTKDREDSLKQAEIGISLDLGEAGDEDSFVIDTVAPGSAEEKAGMKIGDIIVCIPAEKIKSARLIAAYLLNLSEGDKVVFKIKRGEKILEITVQY